MPFTAALVAALQARDYVKAGEVLLDSSVFAVSRESQALVRQMVMGNDRLWSIPREMVLQVERPAIDRLNELKLPTLIMLGELDLFQREEAELLAWRIAGAARRHPQRRPFAESDLARGISGGGIAIRAVADFNPSGALLTKKDLRKS